MVKRKKWVSGFSLPGKFEQYILGSVIIAGSRKRESAYETIRKST